MKFHFIYDITESSIHIAPPATDPEASYPIYEVFINDSTVIEGAVNTFNELTLEDNVKVWVNQKGDGKEVAEKIVVY
ncbi:hypothetical protein [Oceanobacillus kapialis]|uniref:Uncharacterized protein n=1 Tax=Oceanobacillus kapialis TaxID=481353 RepID=A0ABW5Q2Q7_9BACI